jgi:phosphoribosylformylglycinamidine (FGAM) synthase-like amidotransferase family enzyme
MGDPLDPPHDTGLRDWDGQVELRVRAGTLVVVEQCTWHAVRQQLDDTPRIWICCTFCSRDAPRCGWFDERLMHARVDDPLLQSVLPRP